MLTNDNLNVAVNLLRKSEVARQSFDNSECCIFSSVNTSVKIVRNYLQFMLC